MDVKKLASVLVTNTGVKPGDLVCISYDQLATDAALAVQAEVLRAGGHFYFDTFPEGAPEQFLLLAGDDQLDQIDRHRAWVYGESDVLIALRAPANTKSLNRFDPTKIARRATANRPTMKRYMERGASGELRWIVTELPTYALAQDAGMSLAEFDDFVSSACMFDLDDPASYWNNFRDWQQGIVNDLTGRSDVHITGPNADLRMSVKGSTWINCYGKHNFTDGEVFAGPVVDSANGWVKVSYPAYFRGNVVEGIRLEFENGRVVKATAKRNQAFLEKTLATDEGASFLGELGIGTHPRIKEPCGSILFDEKMGGTFHIAFGSGYPESGSTNESAIHWDMIVAMGDGGRITMDDECVYENGEFLIGDHEARRRLLV